MKHAKRYRKIPVEIEAIQWTGDNIEAINNWVAGYYEHNPQRVFELKDDDIVIKTLEGSAIGNWIIRGVEGEFYPCKDSVFKKTYEQQPPIVLCDNPTADPFGLPLPEEE